MKTVKKAVIIVAGGSGSRIGPECPKQFRLLGGIPMLMHTIRAFHLFDEQIHIIVALPESSIQQWSILCKEHNFAIEHSVVAGGITRFHSVRKGLQAIEDAEMLGVHDGARPFVTPQLIHDCYATASQYHCGVVPVINEVNTVRLLTGDTHRVIDRQLLKIVQTPQVFPTEELISAYRADYDPSFTDDATVAEKYGLPIRLVPGEETNFKITTPFDLSLAEAYCKLLSNR